jgi:hypothetical protein
VKVLDYVGVKLETSSPPAENSKGGSTHAAAKQAAPTEVTPEMKPVSDSTPNVNVTSHNQAGGITAHTVNVGEPPRRMNTQLAAELDRVTKGYKKYKVTCALSDAEAYGLAAEMMSYLKSKGLEVDGGESSGLDAAIERLGDAAGR